VTPGSIHSFRKPSATPKPLPFRCGLEDCMDHPGQKEKDSCVRNSQERCKKEWERLQSEAAEQDRLVNSAVGANARKTLIKMNSEEYASWVQQDTLVAAPYPTVGNRRPGQS
jgi:hypothetical protein